MSNGLWDFDNCVISDFGIGGQKDKKSENLGTPGFASPEQFVGFAGQASDNYSLGKVMVFLFSNWETAWRICYLPLHQPITVPLLSSELAILPYKLQDIIQGLLNVSISTIRK